jgi:hypothetical protein
MGIMIFVVKDKENPIKRNRLWGDESSPVAKSKCSPLASRKGVVGDCRSEVSGTAKVGTYEHSLSRFIGKLHKRHRGVVKVAQHTKGWALIETNQSAVM